jgi:hypothetical protein
MMADEGTFRLSLLNVEGQPAADPKTNVSFVAVMSNQELARKNGLTFPQTYDFLLPSFPQTQGLICWIDPQRYRTCHSNIFTLQAGQVFQQSPKILRLPGKWNMTFTRWVSLDAAFDLLKEVLTHSANVSVKETGQPLGNFAGDVYDDVVETPTILAKTSLLNLYAKMRLVPTLTGGPPTWFSLVRRVLVVGQERFIGIVDAALWDAVKSIYDNIGANSGFVRADTALHTGNVPAPYDAGVSEMISIKSHDAHGNLQLTMAKSVDKGSGVATFLLDADIDEDLEFFQHSRDLFVHLFSGGTHPIDVHEILIDSYGLLDLGYTLV